MSERASKLRGEVWVGPPDTGYKSLVWWQDFRDYGAFWVVADRQMAHVLQSDLDDEGNVDVAVLKALRRQCDNWLAWLGGLIR